MKIKLFCLGLKGYNVIKAIHEKRSEDYLICTIGRDVGIDDDFSAELEAYCIKNYIKYTFRSDEDSEDVFDFAIAVGWKWIINNVAENKLVVIHDSLLPKYRGFAPLVNALLKKESEVGVTALLGVDKYDRGRILLQKKMRVLYPTTISNELKRMSELYVELAFELIDILSNSPLSSLGEEQDEKGATYSLWLDEQDYRINWLDSASNIAHFIACVGNPYRGATALLNGNPIRIINAKALDDVEIENRHIGKVIFVENNQPVVVCGEGLLLIENALDLDGASILPLKFFRSRFS